MLAKPIFASSRSTRSAVISVRAARSACALAMAFATLASANRRHACTPAPFGLYPARIAACLPFRSTRNSRTKAAWRTVSPCWSEGSLRSLSGGMERRVIGMGFCVGF